MQQNNFFNIRNKEITYFDILFRLHLLYDALSLKQFVLLSVILLLNTVNVFNEKIKDCLIFCSEESKSPKFIYFTYQSF